MDGWMDGCLGASGWVRPWDLALWLTPTLVTLNYCLLLRRDVLYLLSWKA